MPPTPPTIRFLLTARDVGGRGKDIALLVTTDTEEDRLFTGSVRQVIRSLARYLDPDCLEILPPETPSIGAVRRLLWGQDQPVDDPPSDEEPTSPGEGI